jgi:hypothetical protein
MRSTLDGETLKKYIADSFVHRNIFFAARPKKGEFSLV